MSLFGDFEYHLQISVGIYIPNSWVMFNWDIYQPLLEIHNDKIEINYKWAMVSIAMFNYRTVIPCESYS